MPSATGAVFVHSANEPNLVAGVATHTLEILEEEPDVDAVFVAIGGGSGLCGACIAGKGIKPGLQVVGCAVERRAGGARFMADAIPGTLRRGPHVCRRRRHPGSVRDAVANPLGHG